MHRYDPGRQHIARLLCGAADWRSEGDISRARGFVQHARLIRLGRVLNVLAPLRLP